MVSLVVECAELTILVRSKCRGVFHHTPVTAILAVHLVVGTNVTPVFATQFATSFTISSAFAVLWATGRSFVALPSAMWLTSLPVQSEATTPSRGTATEAARVTVASTTSAEVRKTRPTTYDLHPSKLPLPGCLQVTEPRKGNSSSYLTVNTSSGSTKGILVILSRGSNTRHGSSRTNTASAAAPDFKFDLTNTA